MCDLWKLNKVVKPDCSFFPAPSEVMQSLKPTSKWYIKADLLQGYHQIDLAPNSMNLFAFALEDSLFLYQRMPLGYCGSSHYFNWVVHLSGISNLQLEADDLLIEGETGDEAIESLHTFLGILLLLANFFPYLVVLFYLYFQMYY